MDIWAIADAKAQRQENPWHPGGLARWQGAWEQGRAGKSNKQGRQEVRLGEDKHAGPVGPREPGFHSEWVQKLLESSEQRSDMNVRPNWVPG